MADKDKITPVYEPGGKFLRWLDNYWYHNKWKTIIIAFIVTVVLVCTFQSLGNETDDMYVMYAGPYKFGMTDTESFKSAFSCIANDRSGDGKTVVELVSIYLMSDEQIKGEAAKISDASGSPAVINYEMFANNKKAFEQQMIAGDTIICLLDPWLYSEVHAADGFMPLEEVLGYTPTESFDGCGIRICDTEFGKYFSVLSGLDKDTVLCIRKISSFSFLKGEKKTREYHEYCQGVFKNIFDFTPPKQS